MKSPEQPPPDLNGMATPPLAGPPQRSWPRLLLVGSFLPGFQLDRYAGGDLAVEVAKERGSVITTSSQTSQLLRLADMLRGAFVRRRDYDVALVTVFSGRAFFYAESVAALVRMLNKPLTLGLHGGSLPEFAHRNHGRVRKLLGRSKFAACPSRYLLERLNPFSRDLQLIPNAIHLTNYHFPFQQNARCRILWLRAFHHIYNPEMAVAMFSQVLSEFPNATLTMVGPDKGDGSLQATRKLAKELDLLRQISFPGLIPKAGVPQVMANHDVFVNTTNIDNMPVSVVEAMACGLPIVSTNVGGIPYLLESGRTGLLVNPGDIQAMAQAVLRLFREPALAQSLRTNGRALAETFDWKVVLPQWHQLLTQAAAGYSP